MYLLMYWYFTPKTNLLAGQARALRFVCRSAARGRAAGEGAQIEATAERESVQGHVHGWLPPLPELDGSFPDS